MNLGSALKSKRKKTSRKHKANQKAWTMWIVGDPYLTLILCLNEWFRQGKIEVNMGGSNDNIKKLEMI